MNRWYATDKGKAYHRAYHREWKQRDYVKERRHVRYNYSRAQLATPHTSALRDVVSRDGRLLTLSCGHVVQRAGNGYHTQAFCEQCKEMQG